MERIKKFNKRASTPIAVGLTVFAVAALLIFTLFSIYKGKSNIGGDFSEINTVQNIYVKEAKINFYLREIGINSFRQGYNSALGNWQTECISSVDSRLCSPNVILDSLRYKINLEDNLQNYKINDKWEIPEMANINFEDVKCDDKKCSFKVNLILTSETDSLKVEYPTTFFIEINFNDAKLNSFNEIHDALIYCANQGYDDFGNNELLNDFNSCFEYEELNYINASNVVKYSDSGIYSVTIKTKNSFFSDGKFVYSEATFNV